MPPLSSSSQHLLSVIQDRAKSNFNLHSAGALIGGLVAVPASEYFLKLSQPLNALAGLGVFGVLFGLAALWYQHRSKSATATLDLRD